MLLIAPGKTSHIPVVATVSIQCSTTADDGLIQALLAGATEVARAERIGGTIVAAETTVFCLSFIVPPNTTYQLNSTQVHGTPTNAIVGSIQEYLL